MEQFFKNILSFAIAIIIALAVKAFIIEFHLIPTGSMIPTINVGDRIIANRFYFGIQNPIFEMKRKKSILLLLQNPFYHKNIPSADTHYIKKFSNKIKRLDVVIFFPPEKPVLGEEYYFKKDSIPVLFSPPHLLGERYVKRVIGMPGEVLEMKNGNIYINGKLLEEPQKRNKDYMDFGPIRIPEGHYFMMGDNRPNSSDSRVWGPVPEDLILGKAWIVMWPLDAIKKIR